MAVRDNGHVTLVQNRPDPAGKGVDPHGRVPEVLAGVDAVAPRLPARLELLDPLGGQPLVAAAVPLDQAGVGPRAARTRRLGRPNGPGSGLL